VGLAASIIRNLKQNKIILIQSDQSKPDGVYINFFNKYVPAAPGPVVLKKRTGAALVPAYIYRKEKRFHHIHIDTEMQLQESDKMELFITINTQMLSNWIADVVIKHPEEWLWLHNRWKREKPAPCKKNKHLKICCKLFFMHIVQKLS